MGIMGILAVIAAPNYRSWMAQQELERRIVNGEIAAGSKLNEVELATALGISEPSVYRYLQKVRKEG